VRTAARAADGAATVLGKGRPALGQSVAMVTKMASGESDTVEQLAQAILADAPLTHRLLRLADSPLYRTRDAAAVTTVSRALVLLGFDQIRMLALSMMLMDRLVKSAQSRAVMRDFGQALGAGTARPISGSASLRARRPRASRRAPPRPRGSDRAARRNPRSTRAR
jgi:hypothetical protein